MVTVVSEMQVQEQLTSGSALLLGLISTGGSGTAFFSEVHNHSITPSVRCDAGGRPRQGGAGCCRDSGWSAG